MNKSIERQLLAERAKRIKELEHYIEWLWTECIIDYCTDSGFHLRHVPRSDDLKDKIESYIPKLK